MNEMQTKSLKALALVLIALASIAYVYHYSRSIDRNFPSRSFTVEGVGELDVTPDVATFSVTVISEGGRAVADVQQQNAEKMNKVNAFLKEQGVEKKDLKTTNYNLSPRYSYAPCTAGSCPAPTIVGYTLSQTLEVKVRDTEKLGTLLSGVVQNGANSVSEVRFVVDDDTEAKNAARAEAMTKAKEKAEALAKAGGFRLGSIVSLYEMSDPGPMPYGIGGGAEMSAVKANVPPSIEPGTQSTKVQINITYEIEQ